MAAGKFEEALARLDEIVRALEKGDLPLEESLKRFEEGVKLSKSCLKMLEEAERKVDILMADKTGNKRLRPFSERDRVATGQHEETYDDDEEEEGGEAADEDEESDEFSDEDEEEEKR